MSRNALAAADHALAALERVLLGLALLAFAGIAALILTGIVARALGYAGPPDGVILVRQLILICIAASLGHVTNLRMHIAIDIFYNLFGTRLKYAANLVALVVGLLGVVPIMWWAGRDLVEAVSEHAYFTGALQVPEWPARLALLLGFVSICLRLIVLLALGLVTPDADRIGPPEPVDDAPEGSEIG